MDELARLIGCLPALGKYAISDPTFYQKLLFGANAPYVYRLDGPGKWEGAPIPGESGRECSFPNVATAVELDVSIAGEETVAIS
uniref:Flavin-containing monooxygenase n=1 Tax=Meloidogyne javanica TaxID=6303 RepID=A0A915MZ82_MELJA